MQTQDHIDFNRIAEAIEYIKNNFKSQPSLDEIAKQVHLSPAHFQRMFTHWAGTSPKKFLQYITVAHAKTILYEEQASLMHTAWETGLSGTSRLHDLFIHLEGMTPAEYKNLGKNLQIHYHFTGTAFGSILIASTAKGICSIAFEEDKSEGMNRLRAQFPQAVFLEKQDEMQENAIRFFERDWSNLSQVKLHLKGTAFQLKVREALLKIPMGRLTTYAGIALQIGNPNASRAVGTAIGSNPIAFLIPCHRVIRNSGIIGDYKWGSTRKTAIIGWESSFVHPEI